MKRLILGVMFLAGTAGASDFSIKSGLNLGSIGGIATHDFTKGATVIGTEWDAFHFTYKDEEFGEIGLFGGKRDIDKHFMLGPSIGTPGGSAAAIATNALQYLDWPILKTLETYGQYVHGYVNLGYDVAHPKTLHAMPDFVGLGGVLKFGK